MARKFLTYKEFINSDLSHNYTSEAESPIHRQEKDLPLDEMRYGLTTKRSERNASLTARTYLERLRSEVSRHDELFMMIPEMILMAKALNPEDARRFTLESLRNQLSETELIDFVNETGSDRNNGWDSKTLEEGIATKAVLFALFSRYKSRLASKNQPIEDKFRILADLIGGVAMLNHDAIRDAVNTIIKK